MGEALHLCGAMDGDELQPGLPLPNGRVAEMPDHRQEAGGAGENGRSLTLQRATAAGIDDSWPWCREWRRRYRQTLNSCLGGRGHG